MGRKKKNTNLTEEEIKQERDSNNKAFEKIDAKLDAIMNKLMK